MYKVIHGTLLMLTGSTDCIAHVLHVCACSFDILLAHSAA